MGGLIHNTCRLIPDEMKKMSNEEFNELFRKRTKAFAIAVLKFLETVVPDPASKVMSYQLCKAATSVGANVRVFCRGRSRGTHLTPLTLLTSLTISMYFASK